MSISKEEEIRCSCGEVFEAELWSAINACEDPELKEALTCGELNVVSCPACGQMFYAENFILYHDSVNELIAFVYPGSFADQATHWAGKMREDFARSLEQMAPEDRPRYSPILLFGLDSLVDILHHEEETGDEVVILEYVAGDLGLSLVRLHPSLARPLQLPKVLPSLKGAGASLRDEVTAGLRRLLEYNPNLTHYEHLLKHIEADTRWSVPDPVIVSR